MELKDEQFEKILTSAKRKRRRRSIGTSVLTVILMVGLLLGGYLAYTNRGPFQGEQLSGVPDNAIRVFDKQGGPFSLLFESYGGYGVNTTGKTMTVYADYYEKTTRKKHETVASLEYSENHPISLEIQWGISPGVEPEELGQLRVNLTNRETNATGTYDLSQIPFTESTFSTQILQFPNERFQLGKAYVFRTWVTGDKIFDTQEAFDPEILAKYPQSLYVYLVIE